MPGVTTQLVSDIRGRVRGKVAVVGIGNPLRGDDGLGPKLIELLREKGTGATLFDCGTTPENYIFPILSSLCETVILVDAADFQGAPGQIKILELGAVSMASFSTHNPSPRLFTDLLKTGNENLNIFVISIQPKTVAFGENLSDEAKAGIAALADAFHEALKS